MNLLSYFENFEWTCSPSLARTPLALLTRPAAYYPTNPGIVRFSYCAAAAATGSLVWLPMKVRSSWTSVSMSNQRLRQRRVARGRSPTSSRASTRCCSAPIFARASQLSRGSASRRAAHLRNARLLHCGTRSCRRAAHSPNAKEKCLDPPAHMVSSSSRISHSRYAFFFSPRCCRCAFCINRACHPCSGAGYAEGAAAAALLTEFRAFSGRGARAGYSRRSILELKLLNAAHVRF